MQDTSQIVNYDTIIAQGEYVIEVKVNIDGVDYDSSKIFLLTTTQSLFAEDTPSVGGCISGEIDLQILMPSVEIPRMAVIKPYIRLKADNVLQYVVNGTTLICQHGSVTGDVATLVDTAYVSGDTLVLTNTYTQTISGWLQKGEYFIDTRSVTQNNDGVDVLTIHGYDAMLKTGARYPKDNVQYPQSDIHVVNHIAQAIGVPVDPRTTALMTKAYSINLPATYLMRNVLRYIAGFYAGNFVISDTGTLLLKGLTSIGIETNYLIDDGGNAILFGEDRLIV